MYNEKDIQFVGKHDYDKETAEKFAKWSRFLFSVGIFQWDIKSSDKSMKKGKIVVRVKGHQSKKEKVFEMAENVVKLLDAGQWDGRKTVTVH